jgi:phage terminase large subunit-like protein
MTLVTRIKLWFERLWFAQHNARVLADMEWRMTLLLENATGGRMSKPYYSTEQMNVEVAANHNALYEDAQTEAFEDCREVIASVAQALVDQQGEPFPNGSESDRLHYWRDKAIAAAEALKDHIAEHSDDADADDADDADTLNLENARGIR